MGGGDRRLVRLGRDPGELDGGVSFDLRDLDGGAGEFTGRRFHHLRRRSRR